MGSVPGGAMGSVPYFLHFNPLSPNNSSRKPAPASRNSSIRLLRGMVGRECDCPQIQRQRPGRRRAKDQAWRRPGTSRAERRGVVPRWPLEVASRIDPPHAKRTDSLQSRRHRPAQGLPGAIQDGEATKAGEAGQARRTSGARGWFQSHGWREGGVLSDQPLEVNRFTLEGHGLGHLTGNAPPSRLRLLLGRQGAPALDIGLPGSHGQELTASERKRQGSAGNQPHVSKANRFEGSNGATTGAPSSRGNGWRSTEVGPVDHIWPHSFRKRSSHSSNAPDMEAFRERAATEEASAGVGSCFASRSTRGAGPSRTRFWLLRVFACGLRLPRWWTHFLRNKAVEATNGTDHTNKQGLGSGSPCACEIWLS